MKYIRKPHSKSRGGCSRCKARRVKCDELDPCTNCKKRQEKCDILQIREVNNRLPCERCIAREVSLDWTREISLMHHFTISTSRSLAPVDEEVRAVWKLVIPELAVQYPFLMHGLLALSALHLAHEKPQEQAIWTPMAFRYQNRAINQFRSMIACLNDHDESTMSPIFAVGVILSMSSMADRPDVSTTNTLGISDVISPLIHIRGVQKVLSASRTPDSMGSLRLLSKRSSHDFPQKSVTNTKLMDYLSDLETTFRTSTDAKYLNTILQAFHPLKNIFVEVSYLAQNETTKWYPGVVWIWPVSPNQTFMSLLQDEYPAALMIFGHFALLSTLFEEWYLQGWPERAIRAVSRALPESWKPSFQWVEDQLSSELMILRGNE